MDVHILNPAFQFIGVIDDYYTLVWTERYFEAGDFELELPVHYAQAEELLAYGNYLVVENSDRTMIIETKKTLEGDDTSFLVTGGTAEHLLKRRFQLEPWRASNNMMGDSIMYELIRSNFEDLAGADRKMSIIDLPASGTVPWMGYSYSYVYEKPESVYDLCVKICKATGLGFRLLREEVSGEPVFMFRIYEGVDRTTQQTDVPGVAFSESFGNLISGSVYLRNNDSVNLVNVYTEDPVGVLAPWGTDGHIRMWYKIPWISYDGLPDEPTGMDLYEAAISVEVNRDIDPDNVMDDLDVLWFLNEQAMEIMNKKRPLSIVEGEFDIQGEFKYGEDFFMGDLVEIVVGGTQASARVVELVRSYSVEGITSYMSVDAGEVYDVIRQYEEES